jgi:hypothetical protein
MSIFDTLKNAIFGSGSQARQPPAAAPPTQSPSAAAAPAATAQGPAAAAGSAPAGQVDIEATLKAMSAKKQEKLNWQSSIVDLMKLVDLDPSLENRKALAGELGYTGDTHDSASMNIWLHQQVMQRLAAAGGKVPDSLRH